MYPDISYILHDLIGTDRDNWLSIFKTFGLFLVLAILVAALILRAELRRRQAISQFSGRREEVTQARRVSPADYLLNGFFGFLIGFKLPYAIANFAALKQDAAEVILSFKGSLIGGILGAALLIAYYVVYDRTQRNKLPGNRVVTVFPADRIGVITTIAAISGVVGAKVFALIEDLPSFFADPVGVFFSGSGLAIYGGLIGGFAGVFWYLRNKDIPVLPVMDAVAPALIVAYGVGRIGCQLSGDGDWGIAAPPVPPSWLLPDWMWSYDFPHNVINEGTETVAGCTDRYCSRLADPRYPTSFYETLMAFTIGGILWVLRKRLTVIPGALFALYLLFNGVERFFIEFVRVNDRYDVLGFQLSQAQIIALLLVVAGMLMGWWTVWRARRGGDIAGA